jgi:hypothetical protein
VNYDTNLVSSGRMAKQTVVLSLQMWDYHAEMTVTVGGNTSGLEVIQSAVENAYETLYKASESGIAALTLTKAGGEDTLLCEDEDEQGDQWLKEMVVGARITSIVPDGTIWKRPKKKRTASAD